MEQVKEAARARAKAWYEANRSRANARARKYHATHRDECVARNAEWRRLNPAANLLVKARHRAKKRGIEFTLTAADITVPARCPVLGIEITPDAPNIDHRPSLDRVDNALGYVAGNVGVVSWRANRLKGDATAGELERIAAFYGR